MTATTTPSRNLGLDLLRLLAIIFVLGSHLRPLPGGHGLFITTWMRGGWVGVDLFFVLSGFLVSGLLFKDHLRHGRVSISRFLIRRGLKIYPAFWVLIGCSWLVSLQSGYPTPARNLLGELLFVQNYAPHMWPHTWSLAIEEHFYLCLALVIWLLLRRPVSKPFSWLPGIFAATALMCLGLRTLGAYQDPVYNYAWAYFPTHVRIDSLFFGALLTFLVHYHRLNERIAWFPPWARILAGSALLAPAFIFPRETARWVTVTGFNLFYVGAGLLVLGAIHLKESSSILFRVLGGLGAASYSIYLWHIPVNYWWAFSIFTAHHDDPAVYWQYVTVSVVGALLFGYLMARIVELPILHLRDRLYPSHADSSARSATASSAPSTSGQKTIPQSS
jgi:peptidoglycan/LPS O-acetylase OafA/YrhL